MRVGVGVAPTQTPLVERHSGAKVREVGVVQQLFTGRMSTGLMTQKDTEARSQ
jgi:hypothetical protein